MVKKSEKARYKNHIIADVIVLGCSLPGIVTAHKLKKKFGDTMDIVVLDLSTNTRPTSKCNVSFQIDGGDADFGDDETTPQIVKNLGRRYLIKFGKDFNIPLPDAIMSPNTNDSKFHKLFEHQNGNTTPCTEDYHDFTYLSFLERFELNQYHRLLDHSMEMIFQSNRGSAESDRSLLRYFDSNSMEKHICESLFFSTTRDIMRTTVRLVCGASPKSVSVLFYLHQCYRTSGSKNHLGGNNTFIREKLLGYCRKRLTHTMQQSIADIIMRAKPIQQIRTYSDEQVILETIKGEDDYICNLLAMALKPDELSKIRFESPLMVNREEEVIKDMRPGKSRKFYVQYSENFWRRRGYSGDILSVKGPILWAMERPKLSATGSLEKYSGIIGYLRTDNDETDSRTAVLDQLVKLFGEEAASPVLYKETVIEDIFIPKCGDYVALNGMRDLSRCRRLEWGAMDIFAEGDVAASLEAGYVTFLNLASSLRPQAQTYDDLSASEYPTVLCGSTLHHWISGLNYISSVRLIVYTTALFAGLSLLKSYLRK